MANVCADQTSTRFVYKWTNLENGRWYVGSHKGTPEDLYIGSGKLLRQAIKKYGIRVFVRRILYRGCGFRLIEEWMLSRADAANDPVSYNLHNNGSGAKHTNIKVLELMREAHLGQVAWNKGRRLGSSAALKAWATKRRRGKITHTVESKLKISQALKGRPAPNKGMKTGRNYRQSERMKQWWDDEQKQRQSGQMIRIWARRKQTQVIGI
jgi:hypothetical protein